MLRNLKPLLGYRLHASDGPAGFLHDIEFDDESWRIRHVVAHAGHRLIGHKVLIAPSAIGDIDWVHKSVVLNMTRDEVKGSPRVETDQPVYQQLQNQAINYYEWVAHWTPFTGLPAPQPEPRPTGDEHLRSVRHLLGYTLEGHEGKVGHLSDFIADISKWRLELLVAGVEHLGSEKQVLLPTDVVRTFLWESRTLRIDLGSAVLDVAPIFNPLSLGDPMLVEEVRDRLAAHIHVS